jgi:tetratricopeptide (TPR) repeat protein
MKFTGFSVAFWRAGGAGMRAFDANDETGENDFRRLPLVAAGEGQTVRGSRHFVCGTAIAAVALATATIRHAVARPQAPDPITIDYPREGSIFPPEIVAPTFVWRDAAEAASVWRIEVRFEDGSPAIEAESRGEPVKIGDIDPRCVSKTNEPPKPTPLEAAAHTWMPDVDLWARIKKHSVARPATVTISGVRDGKSNQAVSAGRVTIETSKDPVGAPIFYRDVPLLPTETERGVIRPLPPDASGLIAWRLRSIDRPQSRLILDGLPMCANCHSFSLDGKTLGMDVDGPENDKGTYAIAPLAPRMSIRDRDVITWNSFRDKPAGHHTIGFLSQVSPDGQYAVTTLNEELYDVNFKDYRFLQVFYPTRGILAWYSRATGEMKALPGADDPRYVQTDGVWSPDGKYLVFARAEARNPYPAGGKLAEYAGDPKETQIQYDLYRVAFNGGKGGLAEAIEGASRNGMSNSFPKVSPDGRWIVFVKCRNGQLMRPDSQLNIVPAGGGHARRMLCNTPLMNSWHSFSPNGRWMVFSSKSRSPYTQMFLTHLDQDGNDSPAVLIENATAANRAVNIPEFVNIPADGLIKMEVPAAEFYALFDGALALANQGRYVEAIEEWKKALKIDPENPKAQNNLGIAFVRAGKFADGIAHLERAVELKPEYAEAHSNLGKALSVAGRPDEAMAQWRTAVELYPDFADAHASLGFGLARKGRLDEAIAHWRKAVEVNPQLGDVQNNLGVALSEKREFDEAIAHFEKALEVKPGDIEIHNNLGAALLHQRKIAEAIAHFETVLRADPNHAQAQFNLGAALVQEGNFDEAIRHFQAALKIDAAFIDAYWAMGNAYDLRGSLREALASWAGGLRLAPNYLPLLKQTAWVMATSPDRSARNGAEAVTLAERARRLTGGHEPEILDALAAAYAEAGRFPEAIETVHRAIALAAEQKKRPLAEALQRRAELYEAKTPFRDTHGSAPPALPR